MKEESKVVENLEKKDELLETEVAEENSEKALVEKELIEKAVKEEAQIENETTDEVSKDVESKVDDEQKAEEVETEEELSTRELKNSEMAAVLVEEAKVIVNNADMQMEECQLLLAKDLEEYDEAKEALNEGGLKECEVLLTTLGYEDGSDEKVIVDEVVFEVKEEVEPVIVQDVSSGKFTGFLMALILAVGVFVGMVYVAIQKLGITIDTTTVPTQQSLEPVFSWYGKLIGMNGDPLFGLALVLFVTILVFCIIYAIRVSTKATKNLNFATQQLEDAEAYTAHKSDCKSEMDRVDLHITDAIKTLNTYQVILNEQKGKLQRILYLEEEKEDFSDYHEKSKEEMKETKNLINSLQNFTSISMSEEGRLSTASVQMLKKAQRTMKRMIERLY